MTRTQMINFVTAAIWLAGAGIIYWLWYTRVFVSDTAESIFGFVLYGVAFFYVFAFFPIREFVENNFFRVKGDRE